MSGGLDTSLYGGLFMSRLESSLPMSPEPPSFVGWVSDLALAHTRALASVAQQEGLRAEDALDAVQEAFQTFLSLPQARSLVGDAEDSRRLLTVVVRNAARNMRRRAFRALPHEDITEREDLAGAELGADQLLEVAEGHVRLKGCVSRLSDVQRRVVTMRMLEELSGEDVARELSLRPDHVATLLYRAKKELLRCMST